MDRRHDEEENMVAVYEASLNGCVITLNTLIQRDPLILNKVSLTALSETPLHIAALLGHLEFSRVLVTKKLKFTEEVDSLGRTPLHLASAEGHTEIVQALLQANADVCLARDQDGRIPLHLAAMRGRMEIIKQLINARRESILVNFDGDSVLHLCVRYNHLDALKLLVVLANGEKLFLNSKDHDGNSILHLAVMLKQMKVVKYLLSVPKIKKEANAMNRIGYTALDILEVCPRDFKCFEIQNILKEAGVKRSADLNSSLSLTLSGISVDEAQPMQSGEPAPRSTVWFRTLWGYICSSLVEHFKQPGNWIEETRGTLMVVATVIASMAFQSGISPPGGVWQQHMKKDGSKCSEDVKYSGDNICKAGTAIFSFSDPYFYQFFLSCNVTSFYASVGILLLVTSGFPLTSRFIIWFLTLAMTTAVVSMLLAFETARYLVTSYGAFVSLGPTYGSILTLILYGVILIVVVMHIIGPLYWIIKKCRRLIRKKLEGVGFG